MSSSSTYFNQLNTMLRNHERAVPSLLVDLNILDENIETLIAGIPDDKDFRLVVKSLPSLDLVRYVLNKTGSKKLMVFHQPFLTDLAEHGDPEWDILLGKPMPIKTATYFYQQVSASRLPKIQWLVDTKNRILEYIQLAQSINRQLNLNIEIDVGLHRGGVDRISDLRELLQIIDQNKNTVKLSGLMGYDPHVAKIPSVIRSRKKSLDMANGFYHKCIALIQSEFPNLWNDQLTLNGAGSPTITFHHADSPLNDISAGSCLVKPTTFDIDTLSAYLPAAFIATPVLKKLQGTTIPGLEKIKRLLSLWNRRNTQSFFIYGGFWKADYCYPIGLKANQLFGESTNQTMVNLSSDTSLEVDDFIFLRPHQSEYVFMHFGRLLAIRDFKIEGRWSPLRNE